MNSLGLLRQSVEMKLVELSGVSVFIHAHNTSDGHNYCLAHASEALAFWRELFPSMKKELSTRALRNYKNEFIDVTYEGKYVKDVTHKSNAWHKGALVLWLLAG